MCVSTGTARASAPPGGYNQECIENMQFISIRRRAIRSSLMAAVKKAVAVMFRRFSSCSSRSSCSPHRSSERLSGDGRSPQLSRIGTSTPPRSLTRHSDHLTCQLWNSKSRVSYLSCRRKLIFHHGGSLLFSLKSLLNISTCRPQQEAPASTSKKHISKSSVNQGLGDGGDLPPGGPNGGQKGSF